MRIGALSSCAVLAGCTPGPGPAARLTLADILPIVTPLTYRELLGEKCGAPGIAVKTSFLADLQAADASLDLLDQVRAESARIEAAERDTSIEYVCTAELFESTGRNAAAAQKAWAMLKTPES